MQGWGQVVPIHMGGRGFCATSAFLSRFFLFQPAILAVRVDCTRVGAEGVCNMAVNLSFSGRAPAILAGVGWCAAGCFFHHFADVGKMASEWWPPPEQASIFGGCVGVLNCRGFLGSWTFRKF